MKRVTPFIFSAAALLLMPFVSTGVQAQSEFSCAGNPYADVNERRLRALDQTLARQLDPVRNALSPMPPEDQPNAPVPDPNPQEALRLINNNIRIDRLESHEKAEIYNLLAYAYYLVDDNARALQNYKNVIAEEGANGPLVTRTLRTIAQLEMIDENYRESLGYYINWACMRETIGAEEYSQIAMIYYRLEDMNQALFYTERAINMVEATGGVGRENWYSMQRSIYYQRGNVPKVVEILKKMVVYYPNPRYWRELGGMFSELEDSTNQLAAYHLAYLQGGIDNESQLKGIGFMLIAAGAPYQGAKLLEDAVAKEQIEPTEDVLRTIGSAYYQAKEMDRALPWMERAAAASNDGEAYGRLAGVLFSLQRYQEAVNAGQEAVRRGGLSRSDQVLLTVGGALHAMKQYDEAIVQFRRINDNRSARARDSWITFVESERTRDQQLRDSGIDLDNL